MATAPLAHLTTLDAGSPQVTVVWVGLAGKFVLGGGRIQWIRPRCTSVQLGAG